MRRRSKIINKKFYLQNTLKVAKEILGCFLIRRFRGKIIRVMITEVEVYRGESDLACHASRGRTPRTEIMYGEAGHAYVYMIYGMYFCLNIVTEKKDLPAAVLIRGAKLFRRRTSKSIDGPGKLCRFLKIDKKLNGWDLTRGEKLWIESRDPGARLLKIKKSKRIGVDYAKHCKEYLWRFSI